MSWSLAKFPSALGSKSGLLKLSSTGLFTCQDSISTHTFCSLGGRGACLAVLSWVGAARSRKGDLEGTFRVWKHSVCVDVASLNWTKPTSPLPAQWRAVLSIHSWKLPGQLKAFFMYLVHFEGLCVGFVCYCKLSVSLGLGKVYLYIWKAKQQHGSDSFHLPKWLQQPGPGQAEARSRELHLGLSIGGRGPVLEPSAAASKEH